MSGPVVVSFGGGVNSTAMLVGLHERGERPDAILFADTGGERQSTYEHVREMSTWCEGVGFPSIVRVDNGARDAIEHDTLEEECLNNKTLPSLAFGFKGCSAKWKRQPMDRWVKTWTRALAAWAVGEKVERCIGIDAGEAHRSQKLVDEEHDLWLYRRPLVEWDWAREECIEAIERAGIGVPVKSACWFCPAMKKREVLALAREEPALFARAVAMERNAAPHLDVIRGLGRHWSWEELVASDRASLFPESTDISCFCADGDEEEESAARAAQTEGEAF